MSPATERAAAWIYRGLWAVLVRAFRVPAQPPSLPVSEGETLESFRPAPGFLRYLKFQFWVLLVPGDILPVAGWIAAALFLPVLGLVLAPLFLFLAVAPDILAYIAIHLRYDTTWYVFTGRSLRIRRGIMVVRETTITFENVQDVKVHQGPLQRYFGIANLVVETAGGGAGGGPGGKGQTMGPHVGLLEGIANVQELRERIMAKVRQSTTAGLGDEHAHGSETGSHASGHDLALTRTWTSAHIAVLHEIHEELRAMR
jgi:membrane protein YdbS with pleckstrin-like domain